MDPVSAIDADLAAALPAGALFAVGGRVRDELRVEFGQAVTGSKDLDYVVRGMGSEALAERLRTLGRVDFVGASFGVFKVVLSGGASIDVALARRERSTGVGHRDFAVESGPAVSLLEDLARRDFRINAIARALPSGEIVDPYGGRADIAARRIDVLSPRAFEEDPLRMLRAAQFAARFEYTLSEEARSSMRACAPRAASISPDRIVEELVKLLVQARKPSVGLELLRESGVLAHVWPELLEGVGVEQNQWHAFDVYRHTLETLDATPPGDLVLRLAALCHDVGKPRTKDGPHFYRHEHVGALMTQAMLTRLRFPNEIVDTVQALVHAHMYQADPGLSDASVRRFIRRIGPARLDRQFALRAADIAGSGLPKRDDANERFQARVYAELERRPPVGVHDLRISGDAVLAHMIERGLARPGFRGDARVGAALHHLLEQVTEQPERNKPETLHALLAQHFGGS